MVDERKVLLTKVEEQMLVDLIEENECLWNASCSDFKNVKKRNELWQQISAKINQPVLDLKKKWKNLRDYKKQKERKNRKEKKRPAGSEDGEENELKNCTDDEIKRGRLSFLDSCPTRRKTKSSLPTPTPLIIDTPSTSTTELFNATTEFEDSNSNINSTMKEPQIKRSRKENYVQTFVDTGHNRVDQIQVLYKEEDIHPIRKLFSCFADCVIELPSDLQRQAKTTIMNLITELEGIASDRIAPSTTPNTSSLIYLDPLQNEMVLEDNVYKIEPN